MNFLFRKIKYTGSIEMSQICFRCISYLYLLTIQYLQMIQKQHIRPFKIHKFPYPLHGNIPDIHQGDFFIPLRQKRRQAASEGIPEHHKLPVIFALWVFYGKKRLRAGQKHLIGVPAIGFFHIVERNYLRFPGIITCHNQFFCEGPVKIFEFIRL